MSKDRRLDLSKETLVRWIDDLQKTIEQHVDEDEINSSWTDEDAQRDGGGFTDQETSHRYYK